MGHKQLLEDYFKAADVHDVQKALACFADDACVHDEGNEHRGKQQIKRWMEATNAKYDTRLAVLSLEIIGDEVAAAVSVSGTFPGSPITLRYVFTFDAGKISSLRIAP
jgi:ketosteroid isomerase-like protein